MRVEKRAPTSALLRDMFEPFLCTDTGTADITVSTQREPMVNASDADTDYRYTQNAIEFASTGVQIVVDGDGYRVSGTREMLVVVLPLIDRVLVRRGIAMLHAATFVWGGRGVIMPAWGGTGKTSTIAKLMRRDDVAFLGDDWTFLEPGRPAARLRQADDDQAAPPHDLSAPLHEQAEAPDPVAPLAPARTPDLGRAPVPDAAPGARTRSRAATRPSTTPSPRKIAFPDGRMSTGRPARRGRLRRALRRPRDDARGDGHRDDDGPPHGQLLRRGAGAVEGDHRRARRHEHGAARCRVLREGRGRRERPRHAALPPDEVPRDISADQASDIIVEQLARVMDPVHV